MSMFNAQCSMLMAGSGNWKLATGNWIEAGSWKLGAGNWKLYFPSSGFDRNSVSVRLFKNAIRSWTSAVEI